MPSRPRRFRRGVGYPSCNRELAPRKRNRNDPNGYYALLGLRTDATEQDVKTRCRDLMKIFHPDGRAPDREHFERIQEIYAVLTDPVEKARYDNTPEGGLYVDSLVKDSLREAAEKTGRPVEDFLVGDAPEGSGWSFWYEGQERDDDLDVALAWYEVLVRVAADSGYRGRIVLVLSDFVDFYRWREEVLVPRSAPDEDLARKLFSASECLSDSSGNV